MIKTFKQKHIQKFYENGKSAKIGEVFKKKLLQVLTILDSAKEAEDMNYPGSDFHQLTGDRNNFYSVSILSNWKLIFRFENQHAYDVEFLDYHGKKNAR